MDSRVQASQEQFYTLLEFMECHGDLAQPLAGAQGRVRSDKLWVDLTNILNAVGGGVSKTTEKWKKVWADLKSKTKKKGLTIRCHDRGTGGGPSNQQKLSPFEERVLSILGPLAVEGQSSIEELGFTRSLIPENVNAEESAEESARGLLSEDRNPICLEIVDEQLPSTSGGSLLGTNTETPGPNATGEQNLLTSVPVASTSQISLLPENPPTPPSARRPQRRTPQSSSSPRRRMRARRRREPTPFERATSEFTAVEMRRLELEETRLRQQHERDMRALDIEHERNLVFSSLVAVAQDWLNYCRGRDNTE
ncbi:hypothetical protein ACJJTC_012271 [Scirpophaga incertulas]